MKAERESLLVEPFRQPEVDACDSPLERNYLGRLCAKDGCPNVPTPGYLLCADCAAARGNV